MDFLTLNIRVVDDQTISFNFFSLDPETTLNGAQFDQTLEEPIDVIIPQSSSAIIGTLADRDPTSLEYQARVWTSQLVPNQVVEILEEANESFLYIDLDEKLPSFPWEFIWISENKLCANKFYVGRGVRVSGPNSRKSYGMNQTFLIVANPDGTLKEASEEGIQIKNMLSAPFNTKFYSQVAEDEFLPALEGVGGFHYSGHSDQLSLHLHGQPITGKVILERGYCPFFVFLNSCSAADPTVWKKQELGLVGSFLKGGTKVLIAPMEIIDSQTAYRVAERFYQSFVKEGAPVGQALCKALDQGASKLSMTPYILYGNPMFKLPVPKTQKEAPPAKVEPPPIPDDPEQTKEAFAKPQPVKGSFPQEKALQPLLRPHEPPKTSMPSKEASQKPDFSQLKVLILEPVTKIAEDIATILKNFGISKRKHLPSYQEGLSYVTAYKPDLVVCNAELRYGSGVDLLRIVRSRLHDNNIPFIVLGSNDPDIVTSVAIWEVDAYLVKPLKMGEATRKIRATLENIHKPKPYDQFINQACEALKRGKHWDAWDSIEEAIKLFPKRPRAMYHRAQIQNEMGRTNDATLTLRENIRNSPKYYKSYELLGNILLTQGRLMEALDVFEEEIKNYPTQYEKQYERHVQIATLLSDCDRFNEAITHFKAALKNNSQSEDALKGLSLAYLRQNDIKESLKFFDRLVSQNKSQVDMLEEICQNAITNDTTDPVIAYLKKEMASGKDIYAFGIFLAKIYRSLGRFKKALESLDQIPHQGKQSLKVLKEKGTIYYGLKRYHEAEQCYRKVVKEAPERKSVVQQYSMILIKLGKFYDAVPHIKHALGLSPHDNNLKKLLVTAYKESLNNNQIPKKSQNVAKADLKNLMEQLTKKAS